MRTEMNIGRFKTLAIASLSAIALAASIAVAQTVTTDQGTQQGTRMERRSGRGGHKGHGWGGMREGGFFKQLNLTEDQKAKIKQIRETFAQTHKPMREQHKLHQEMLSVLTAEQKAQLEQSRAQFKGRRGQMRNNDNQ